MFNVNKTTTTYLFFFYVRIKVTTRCPIWLIKHTVIYYPKFFVICYCKMAVINKISVPWSPHAILAH
jgi:hypothetical protein